MAGNKNSGRKSSSDEELLISKLDSIINSDDVIRDLAKQINDGNFRAIQLYFSYKWGNPKKIIEVQSLEEQPIFNIPTINFVKTKE
tara:strand:- start:434 stop:691 length:258 start_codon:yes stop_codon:yes gene_type:complete